MGMALGCGRGDAVVRETRTERLMGAPWTITAYAGSKTAASAGIDAAFAEVGRLERILSDYDPASELSVLSAAAPTTSRVSDDLWRVLAESVRIRDSSGGAFDPTVGPLTTLWRRARRSGRLPDPAKLAAARAAVGPSTLRLDAVDRTVELRVPGMRLDLGGIGMGYAMDRAMDVLRMRGIRSAMIDASGDIAVSAAPPGRSGWRIAVARVDSNATEHSSARPTDSIELVDAAITTSGDAFQAVEIDGVRYSHIVDPRTGMGVAGRSAVTVIARDGTTADAVATAASVLGPEAGVSWVERIPGACALFQSGNPGMVREVFTAGWPRAAKGSPPSPPSFSR